MENSNDNIKKCSFCGMDIPGNASRCPYCSSLLDIKIDDRNYFNENEEKQIPVVNEEEPAEYNVNPQAKATGENMPESKPAVNYSSYGQGNDGNYRQNYSVPNGSGYSREPLSNGLKVFLTILFTLIPGLGQLAGIITAIVFMNSDDDKDRKSFGVALLVASIIMFVLSCIGCFVLAMVFSMNSAFEFK